MPNGGSWVRAGRFSPTPAELAAIRQEIHYDGTGFHRTIEDPALLQHFPNGLDLSVEQLSRPPRGYQASDADLAYLKLKSFGFVRLFADAEVLAPSFIDQVVDSMHAARPWVTFLNQALGDD
jgi:uncharacterized protein (DUF2461 family)